MAEVNFLNRQKDFYGGIIERYVRVMVYPEDYDLSLLAAPLCFKIDKEISDYGIPIGFGVCEDLRDEYSVHKCEIEKLLKDEELNPQVILYTNVSLIKEAFYKDVTKSMSLKLNITEQRNSMFWATCDESDRVLLVAFENMAVYNEELDYIKKNLE